MANGKYILVEEELLLQLLSEIRDLKQLILNGNQALPSPGEDKKLDTADLMQDLKMNRRTIYNYRKKKNMPSHRRDNGRIFYWKSEIDAYFGKK